MSRQQEALTLAGELMADFELSRTSTVQRLLKSMRVARLLDDEDALRWLGYELRGVPMDEFGIAWMDKARRWTDKNEQKGYWVPLADLDAIRSAANGTAADMGGAFSVGGDYALLATNARAKSITDNRTRASMLDKVFSAVDAALYEYAADVHRQLTYSELQADLFEAARKSVDAALAGIAGEALLKIESIAERLGGGDPEAISQAMSTCRRLIDSVADYVFPARDEPYKIGERELQVKSSHVLNRLQAYVNEEGVSRGRSDRLRRSLSDLYEQVSKGVHSNVTRQEARFLFLSTYIVLGEVLTVREGSLRHEA